MREGRIYDVVRGAQLVRRVANLWHARKDVADGCKVLYLGNNDMTERVRKLGIAGRAPRRNGRQLLVWITEAESDRLAALCEASGVSKRDAVGLALMTLAPDALAELAAARVAAKTKRPRVSEEEQAARLARREKVAADRAAARERRAADMARARVEAKKAADMLGPKGPTPKELAALRKEKFRGFAAEDAAARAHAAQVTQPDTDPEPDPAADTDTDTDAETMATLERWAAEDRAALGLAEPPPAPGPGEF